MRLMAVSGEAPGSAGTTVGSGLVRLTWLLQADSSYHRSICQPALGSTELPAALGSYFARGALDLGLVFEQMPGRRAAAGWLSRAHVLAHVGLH